GRLVTKTNPPLPKMHATAHLPRKARNRTRNERIRIRVVSPLHIAIIGRRRGRDGQTLLNRRQRGGRQGRTRSSVLKVRDKSRYCNPRQSQRTAETARDKEASILAMNGFFLVIDSHI